MEYAITRNDELYHFGVKGMKWGVRRYRNKDGSLTSLGKTHDMKLQEDRVASDKKATIKKSTKLYRVSDSDKSDTSDDKIYVSASKKSADYYIKALGSGKIYNKGKAYVHEYIANNDIKLPSKKVMEKIELGLLNDKRVQKELVDSLMKKGYTREQAAERVKPYNRGVAFAQKTGLIVGGAMTGSVYGAASGTYLSAPTGIFAFIPITAIGGAIGGGIVGGRATTKERSRALNTVRASYGDKNNKVTNKLLRDEFAKSGYNGIKDYNDRRAFGKKGEHAVIVFDSNKNLTSTKISEIKSNDYGKAYARNYLKEHPKTKLEFNDLVKDGESEYKKYYENGIIARAKAAENRRILEENKNKQ